MHTSVKLLFIPALAALILLACSSGTYAEDDSKKAEIEKAYEHFTGMLAGRIRSEGGTIGIEKAIIKLKDLGTGDKLAAHIGHDRRGPDIVWALTELGNEEDFAVIKETFEQRQPNQFEKNKPDVFERRKLNEKVEISLYIAGYASKSARAWLNELAKDKNLNNYQAARIKAALLRARDKESRKQIEKALKIKGDKPEATREICDALLLIGDARAKDMLDAVSKLATDERAAPEGMKTMFSVQKRINNDKGGYTFVKECAPLKTVGQVALEAGSRIVRPLMPEMMAWWYLLEKSPRFSRDEAGAKFLKSYVGTVKAAAKKKKAMGAEQAVAALCRKLRAAVPSGGGHHGGMGAVSVGKIKISAISFSGTEWEINFAEENSEKLKTAKIDRNGQVSIS